MATDWRDERIAELEGELARKDAELATRDVRIGQLEDEVDHPDTQREKRTRTGSLAQQAREVKFVAVDFTRDDLGERLAAAGHDPSQRTTWIWEGVVMYLTPPEVEATLRVVAACSAPGSRLVIVYISPGGWIVPLMGLVVRRLGEPFRSRYRASPCVHSSRATASRCGETRAC